MFSREEYYEYKKLKQNPFLDYKRFKELDDKMKELEKRCINDCRIVDYMLKYLGGKFGLRPTLASISFNYLKRQLRKNGIKIWRPKEEDNLFYRENF